ncbi:MAG TPA: TraR/DksA C4-type zinc finger protein, partial [Gemmatimonadales bacterium]|nr:TraR/DksA C4-type zinc finger protein [Gemmatimonadales bacterium]
ALMNQGLGQASETRTLEELGLVHDALARLEGGTYGICHTCGRPIPYARLVVMPEARECAGCRR